MMDATRDGKKISMYSHMLSYWVGYKDAADKYGASGAEMELIEAIIESIKSEEAKTNVVSYRGDGG